MEVLFLDTFKETGYKKRNGFAFGLLLCTLVSGYAVLFSGFLLPFTNRDEIQTGWLSGKSDMGPLLNFLGYS